MFSLNDKKIIGIITLILGLVFLINFINEFSGSHISFTSLVYWGTPPLILILLGLRTFFQDEKFKIATSYLTYCGVGTALMFGYVILRELRWFTSLPEVFIILVLVGLATLLIGKIFKDEMGSKMVWFGMVTTTIVFVIVSFMSLGEWGVLKAEWSLLKLSWMILPLMSLCTFYFLLSKDVRNRYGI